MMLKEANEFGNRHSTFHRDKGIESPIAQQHSEQRKPSVHERLLNYESKSLRPYYRRTESQIQPRLDLEGVKQNAIKFYQSEHDYRSFLSSNSIFTGHSTNSTYLDVYKK